MHEPLLQLLKAQEYITFAPPHRPPGLLGSEPSQRWTRPVALLINEGNYSDAHIFPYAFKYLGFGLLIGSPVAGTGTAVWWKRMQNRNFKLGIPQVGFMTQSGDYLENNELIPDIVVEHTPHTLAGPIDPQVQRGVEELLKQLSPLKK